MLKVVNIPLTLRQQLLDWVSQNNEDSRFYVWPGTLKPEINRILVLINLKRSEYQPLACRINKPEPLDMLLADEESRRSLDKKIIDFLRIVARYSTSEDKIRVDPPFIFQPHVQPYGSAESYFGKPMLRVGDSVFNGNPKSGNGLGQHVRNIGQIHDRLLFNFN